MPSSSDDENRECGTCMLDLREVHGPIRQCPEGHVQCESCFADIGGAAASCPACGTTMGEIRNRYAERDRDKYQALRKDGSGRQKGKIENFRSFFLSWAENKNAAAKEVNRDKNEEEAKNEEADKKKAEDSKQEEDAEKRRIEQATGAAAVKAEKKMQEKEESSRRRNEKERLVGLSVCLCWCVGVCVCMCVCQSVCACVCHLCVCVSIDLRT